MTVIVLNSETIGHFSEIDGEAEVRDEQGRLLGKFVPASEPEFDCPLTEQEIQKALAEPGGKPLRQILDDLRARA